MRHRQHHITDLVDGCPLNRQFQQRNECLGPLQGETLGSQEPLLDKLLKHRGSRHLLVDSQLLTAVELDAVFAPLHPDLQPLPHTEVVHVHELHADRPAVGDPQPLDDRSQRHRLRALDRVGREHPVHVLLGEVIEPGIEFRKPGPGPPQRVDLRHQVATHPVGPHQLVNPVLKERHPFLAGGAGGMGGERERHHLTGRSVWQADVSIGDRERLRGGDAIGSHKLGAIAVVLRPIAVGRVGYHLAGSRSALAGCRAVAVCSQRLKIRPPVRPDAQRIGLVLVKQFLEEPEAGGTGGIDAVERAHGHDPLLTGGSIDAGGTCPGRW